MTGMVGAVIGAQFVQFFSQQVLLGLFGLLMTGTGFIVMFNTSKQPDEQALRCQPSWTVSAIIGFCIGLLTGFLGVGGGFLIVPAIAMLLKCSLRIAVGTSLMVISFNSFAGFLSHAYVGHIPYRITFVFLFFTLMGTLLGSLYAERVPLSLLGRVFAGLIILTGGFMLIKNILLT